MKEIRKYPKVGKTNSKKGKKFKDLIQGLQKDNTTNID